jgi:hypothetical protein
MARIWVLALLVRRMANLVLVAVVVCAAAGCGGPMRSDELGRSIDTLASTASEGRLIAADIARDRTKATFARVRARELGETADHEGEKLADATPRPEIRHEMAAAIRLAQEISDTVGEIQTFPSDRTRAIETTRKLDDLSKQAEDLSKGL